MCLCVYANNATKILIITPSDGADISECSQNNGGCSDQAVCSNTEGSFKCNCKNGFAGDGFTCGGMSSTSELLTVLPNRHDYPLLYVKDRFPASILANVDRSKWNLAGVSCCMKPEPKSGSFSPIKVFPVKQQRLYLCNE